MYCSNCGKEIEINVKFCSSCGQPVHSGTFCSSCGAPNSSLAQVCSQCGTRLVRAPASAPPQYIPPVPQNAAPPPQNTQAQPQYSAPAPQYSSPVAQSATQPSPQIGTKMTVNSPKSKAVTAILALLFGQLGIHRFYVGKKWTAIIQLILAIIGYVVIISSMAGYLFLGVLGLWILIDFIIILSGKFKDGKGLYIR